MSRSSAEIGVLLIHGFSSTPSVFDSLQEQLKRNGYQVASPLLRGHGTHPDDLATTTSADWVDSVRPHLAKLLQRCRRVVIVGFSLGGNVACVLADEYPVSGLVLIATPRWINRQAIIGTLAPVLQRAGVRYFHKKFKKRLEDGQVIGGPTHSYASVRLKSVSDLLQFVNKQTEPHLVGIVAPTLIIQSANDGQISARSGRYFYNAIAAKQKQLVWVNDAHHEIHLSPATHRHIVEFIEAIKRSET